MARSASATGAFNISAHIVRYLRTCLKVAGRKAPVRCTYAEKAFGLIWGDFDADFPLTKVSMMAIWATTVLHRHFPAVRETPDLKGFLRWPVTAAESDGFAPPLALALGYS
jgi:hypothetical protein